MKRTAPSASVCASRPAAIVATLLLAAACTSPSVGERGAVSRGGEGAATPPSPGAPMSFTSTGTLASLDANAGTLSITHEGVAGARLVAGTTSFALATDPPRALASGQRVEFEFVLREGRPTITRLEPIESEAESTVSKTIEGESSPRP